MMIMKIIIIPVIRIIIIIIIIITIIITITMKCAFARLIAPHVARTCRNGDKRAVRIGASMIPNTPFLRPGLALVAPLSSSFHPPLPPPPLPSPPLPPSPSTAS